MAITATSLTTGASTSNVASYASASITPAANQLILAWVSNSESTAAGLPTLSGNGLTWVEVANKLRLNSQIRQTLFRAMGASPSAGAVTATFGAGQTGCEWSIASFDGIDTSGSNGSGAIVQSAVNEVATTTSLTITLASFANANNAAAGACTTNLNGTITEGSGFTALGTTASRSTPPESLLAEWKATEDTTVDFTFATGLGLGIAAEIKMASGVDATAQKARPISDTAAGGWTASSGFDLFAMVDEATASDTDYITGVGV